MIFLRIGLFQNQPKILPILTIVLYKEFACFCFLYYFLRYRLKNEEHT